jgi:hypothetical protein
MRRPTNDELEAIPGWIDAANEYIVAANDYGVQLQFGREALRVRGDVRGEARIVLALVSSMPTRNASNANATKPWRCCRRAGMLLSRRR